MHIFFATTRCALMRVISAVAVRISYASNHSHMRHASTPKKWTEMTHTLKLKKTK